MSRVRYVVDTSAFARSSKPIVRQVLGPLASAGRIALCGPVAFELGHAARNRSDHDAIQEAITAYPTVPVNGSDHRRSLEIQSLLASRGEHRALSLVDALVAAVAESRELTVLHYDADFELIADAIDLEHEWVVPRGTAD